jgi:putative ABC transport system permease protein
MTRIRQMAARLVGTGGVLTVVFALLAGCCAYLSLAGPREDLTARTQALRQTLSKLAPLTTTILGQAVWNDFVNLVYQNPTAQPMLNSEQMQSSVTEIHHRLMTDGVPLRPTAKDWAGVFCKLVPVVSSVPARAEPAGPIEPPKMEVTYRTTLSSFTHLLAGSYPSTPTAKNTLEVVITPQTAQRLGLRVGETVSVSGQTSPVRLDITGLVAPVGASSAFWADDPTFAAPQLITTQHTEWWDTGALTNDTNFQQFQALFSYDNLTMNWGFPIDLTQVTADQAPTLQTNLGTATTQTLVLPQDLAPAASSVSLAQGVGGVLATFIQTEASAEDLSWLVFVSLAVAASVVLLLAARLLSGRRHSELVVLRARGASARQVARLTLAGTALCCVPLIAVGTLLAVVTTHEADQTPPLAWVLFGVVLFVALTGPTMLGVGATRSSVARPRNRAYNVTAGRPRRRWRGGRRLVLELTLAAGAIAGLVVYRQHPAATSGVNPLASAAPVLVAIPIVLVIGRITPLLIALIIRLSKRRASAPALVALARASRTTALTAFAVVLALTLAAFGGMIRDAITRGEVAASWQTSGADVTVNTEDNAVFSRAATTDFASLPGVQHSVPVWDVLWTMSSGEQVTVLGVNPAQYAAFTASSPGWPTFNPSALNGVGKVIVSPSLARSIGHGMLAFPGQSMHPVTFHVAGTVSGTPALPGNPAFAIASLATVEAQGAPAPNLMLLNGGVDLTAVRAAVHKWVPGSVVTLRSTSLDTLTAAPVQHATYLIFLLAIFAAAALAIVAVACEAAMDANERELTLARLAAMGLTGGQRARLIAGELAPGLIAAAIAAGIAALALPRVIAPSLDLSVFTGSGASVTVSPDFNSLALPVAALILLAGFATAAGARPRRSFAEQLRIGG